MIWQQHYDPLGNAVLSTLLAALPVVTLLGLIAWGRIRIHIAALCGLAVALAVAMGYGMPLSAATASALYGAAYGLFPIGWIVLNVLFVYRLTVKSGLFDVLRGSLSGLTPDPRLQLILIAFSLGAFIEGVAGFGTPVAITGAILIQLGFKPLEASVLSLIANTAPVAFGSLGIPITTLSQVTGLDVLELSRMAGRQLPFFSVIVPFWVVAAYAGWRGMLAVWPAALTAGVAFGIPQFIVSNYHGPWLVDIVSGACSMAALVGLFRVWRPREVLGSRAAVADPLAAGAATDRRLVFRAWLPWTLLSLLIFVWGLPQMKNLLDGKPQKEAWLQNLVAPTQKFFSTFGRRDVPIANLDGRVQRTPPVAPADAPPEKAVFALNWLSATGTAILLSGLISAMVLGIGLRAAARAYLETLVQVRFSLLTIAGMLALGHVTKYSGIDATLGLAMAGTGVAYPFFGTLLGWMGVALTGSDTASNVLFGSLQKITSEQLNLSPVLMCAANSTGGVMGKMIDAQSIVVASTATGFYGSEGQILRNVFWHSLILASLVGILVTLQAYAPIFSSMVVGEP
jgi:lactate permease